MVHQPPLQELHPDTLQPRTYKRPAHLDRAPGSSWDSTAICCNALALSVILINVAVLVRAYYTAPSVSY